MAPMVEDPQVGDGQSGTKGKRSKAKKKKKKPKKAKFADFSIESMGVGPWHIRCADPAERHAWIATIRIIIGGPSQSPHNLFDDEGLGLGNGNGNGNAAE